jgi:deoxyribodipyrimidine photolyase-related protein
MGDQLSLGISSLYNGARNIVMVESLRKCGSGKWHKRRVAFIISAMRHFRDDLKNNGYEVDYFEWAPDFTSSLGEHVKRKRIEKLYVMKPKGLNAIRFIDSLGKKLSIDVEVTENNQFMCPDAEFARWLVRRKQPRIIDFYRMMRKTRDVLMDGGLPVGGKWTYDRENKKNPRPEASFPEPMKVADDGLTKGAVEDVLRKFPDNYGELTALGIPVDRQGALRWEKDFIDRKLAGFGPYEYVMSSTSPTLYHSMTSVLTNAGLLSPRECVEMAESAYDEGRAPINSVEGYLRQVIGWREYVAGMYTSMAPRILNYNFFGHTRKLPQLYLDAPLTRMNCMAHAVRAITESGYTNHSDRLMVLGNFALLAGIDPLELYRWVMMTNIDACEWAAAADAICLSQYADGGRVAMKPYVSSAAFINTYSDYCKSCHYSWRKKVGENACPFNYLYWDFIGRTKYYKVKTCRLTIPRRAFDRAKPAAKKAYESESEAFLRRIEWDEKK